MATFFFAGDTEDDKKAREAAFAAAASANHSDWFFQTAFHGGSQGGTRVNDLRYEADVGPIYGGDANMKAPSFAARFMEKNGMEKDWIFTGDWASRDGTSVCILRRVFKDGAFFPRGVHLIFSFASEDVQVVTHARDRLQWELGMCIHYTNVILVANKWWLEYKGESEMAQSAVIVASGRWRQKHDGPVTPKNEKFKGPVLKWERELQMRAQEAQGQEPCMWEVDKYGSEEEAYFHLVQWLYKNVPKITEHINFIWDYYQRKWPASPPLAEVQDQWESVANLPGAGRKQACEAVVRGIQMPPIRRPEMGRFGPILEMQGK
jgi:hypothetical protein